MSNQEQQFYSPEQSPPPSQQSYQYYQTPNSVNADPREQQQQEMYGDSEYYTGRGEKLQPHPRKRKGFRLLWLLPLVLLFVIGGASYGLFGSHDGYDGKHFGGPKHEQTFNVGNTPKLIIYDNVGTIHIHSDDDSSNTGTITVSIDKSNDSESGVTINPDKVTGTITINATQQGFGDNDVNIDVTMPRASSIQLTDGNGDVDIDGVAGNINAQTTKGRIHADHVSGQVALSSTNGDVSLENGSLSGQSSLHSDNGNISYDGSIDSQGTYKFDTTNGSVDVSLPSNSSFHLNAHSTNSSFENEFGSDDVGNGTRPQLTVSSVNGSIKISKNG